MIRKHVIKVLKGSVACLAVVVVFAGCSEHPGKDREQGKALNAAEEIKSQLKALPAVALTATKIQENIMESAVRVEITASGAFGSNIITKTDPERIIVILHNAIQGEVPSSIEVNDGTINRVEIAQLDTGKGSAVRITIGLDRRSEYTVTPDVNGLLIDVRRRT